MVWAFGSDNKPPWKQMHESCILQHGKIWHNRFIKAIQLFEQEGWINSNRTKALTAAAISQLLVVYEGHNATATIKFINLQDKVSLSKIKNSMLFPFLRYLFSDLPLQILSVLMQVTFWIRVNRSLHVYVVKHVKLAEVNLGKGAPWFH